MTEMEEANYNYDRCLSYVEQACMKMCAGNEELCSKMIYLEARSRRQNIKILGLPEKIENERPTEFWMAFIPELLGASNFPRPLVVGRAHRLGKQPPVENAHLHVMIARIHHFQIKEKILQLACQQFPLNYGARQFTSSLNFQ